MKEYVKSTSQLVTTNLKIKNLIQQSLYIVTAKAFINGPCFLTRFKSKQHGFFCRVGKKSPYIDFENMFLSWIFISY